MTTTYGCSETMGSGLTNIKYDRMNAIRRATTSYFSTAGSRVKATYNHITRRFRVVWGENELYNATLDKTATVRNIKVIFDSYAEEYP